jgi:hypothetical protein
MDRRERERLKKERWRDEKIVRKWTDVARVLVERESQTGPERRMTTRSDGIARDARDK